MDTHKLDNALRNAVASLQEVGALATEGYLKSAGGGNLNMDLLDLSYRSNDYIKYLNSHISSNKAPIRKKSKYDSGKA